MEGRVLLEAARAAIGSALGVPDAGAPPVGVPDWASRDGATFVTLTIDGRLRGCIGSLEAWRPLLEDVRANARHAAFRDPRSFFRKYAEIGEEEALAIAEKLWTGINLPNLQENILPTRQRASLILTKGASHRIQQVALRRL